MWGAVFPAARIDVGEDARECTRLWARRTRRPPLRLAPGVSAVGMGAFGAPHVAVLLRAVAAAWLYRSAVGVAPVLAFVALSRGGL